MRSSETGPPDALCVFPSSLSQRTPVLGTSGVDGETGLDPRSDPRHANVCQSWRFGVSLSAVVETTGTCDPETHQNRGSDGVSFPCFSVPVRSRRSGGSGGGRPRNVYRLDSPRIKVRDGREGCRDVLLSEVLTP